MVSLVFVIKKIPLNMSPIFDGYRVMAAWNLDHGEGIIQNAWNKTIKKYKAQ
jgi:hypothetical protein